MHALGELEQEVFVLGVVLGPVHLGPAKARIASRLSQKVSVTNSTASPSSRSIT